MISKLSVLYFKQAFRAAVLQELWAVRRWPLGHRGEAGRESGLGSWVTLETWNRLTAELWVIPAGLLQWGFWDQPKGREEGSLKGRAGLPGPIPGPGSANTTLRVERFLSCAVPRSGRAKPWKPGSWSLTKRGCHSSRCCFPGRATWGRTPGFCGNTAAVLGEEWTLRQHTVD